MAESIKNNRKAGILTELAMWVIALAMIISGPWFAWQSWRGFHDGVIAVMSLDGGPGPVTRAENPSQFNYSLTVSVIFGLTGLIIDIAILNGLAR